MNSSPSKNRAAACILALILGSTSLNGSPITHNHQTKISDRILHHFQLEPLVLTGRMKTAQDSHPLILVTRDNQLTYRFPKHNLFFRVEFTKKGNKLFVKQAADAPWKTLEKEQYLDRILNSDATYEDLTLNFIHWSQTVALGPDTIKTVPALKYEASAPPGEKSSYSRIRYWVEAASFALLRADALNDKGQVIKRLEVNGVIRLGNVVVIKELQISSMIPGRDLSASRTYIEFWDVKPAETG
ncbi:MAG: outer membrane lipoprotein-sorting protein [Methylacidiphilales bacterium]|nr:outer membrane lipoprotein-sorting protein [Candidatus Methylacidiphilales bacterium]MDW8349039.1 outer membrane lipoprotein-sorting protein [Verrucomicrobiae bacterium]